MSFEAISAAEFVSSLWRVKYFIHGANRCISVCHWGLIRDNRGEGYKHELWIEEEYISVIHYTYHKVMGAISKVALLRKANLLLELVTF